MNFEFEFFWFFLVEEKLEEKGSAVAEFVVSLYGCVPASVSRHLMERLLAFLTVGLRGLESRDPLPFFCSIGRSLVN